MFGISISTSQFPGYSSGPLNTILQVIDTGPAEHGRLAAGPNDRFLGTWQHASGTNGALDVNFLILQLPIVLRFPYRGSD